MASVAVTPKDSSNKTLGEKISYLEMIKNHMKVPEKFTLDEVNTTYKLLEEINTKLDNSNVILRSDATLSTEQLNDLNKQAEESIKKLSEKIEVSNRKIDYLNKIIKLKNLHKTEIDTAHERLRMYENRKVLYENTIKIATDAIAELTRLRKEHNKGGKMRRITKKRIKRSRTTRRRNNKNK
jgi:hypothetical protein